MFFTFLDPLCLFFSLRSCIVTARMAKGINQVCRTSKWWQPHGIETKNAESPDRKLQGSSLYRRIAIYFALVTFIKYSLIVPHSSVHMKHVCWSMFPPVPGPMSGPGECRQVHGCHGWAVVFSFAIAEALETPWCWGSWCFGVWCRGRGWYFQMFPGSFFWYSITPFQGVYHQCHSEEV